MFAQQSEAKVLGVRVLRHQVNTVHLQLRKRSDILQPYIQFHGRLVATC